MAFRGALTGKEPTAPVEKKIEQIAAEKKKKDEPAEKKEAKAEEKSEAKTEVKEDKKDAKAEEKKDEKKDAKIEEKKDAKIEEKKDAKVEEKKAEQRYTLQLSSFQDKSEAEAYLATVKEQGYAAQITQADVEGKGTFYRVRMGTYRSLDAATSAKEDFEKASSRSASIMKL